MPTLTDIINKDTKYLEPQQLGNINNIYDNIFYQNNDLIYVQLPNTIKTLSNSCFQNCYNLCYVELPEGINTLSYNCFKGCKSLNNIVFPSTLTSIDGYAFSDCIRLSNIDSSKVPGDCKIGERIFDKTALAENTDGLLLFANGQIALQYCNENYESEVYIPETVKTIVQSCFQFSSHNTGGIVNIKIPNSVTLIDSNAFIYQPLLSIVDIGENVSKIGYQSFVYCNSLSTLIFRQPVDFKISMDNAFMNKSAEKKDITIYTDNNIIKKYDWKSKNYNATMYPLSDYTGETE